MALESDIVPRGKTPIFFDDSQEEFQANDSEICRSNPLDRIYKKLDYENEVVQFFRNRFYLVCLQTAFGVPGYLHVFMVDPVLQEIFQVEAISINEPLLTPSTASKYLKGYPINRIQEIVNDIYTFADDNVLAWAHSSYGGSASWVRTNFDRLFDYYQKSNNKIEWKSWITAEIGWFPGQFPQTPFFHMVFWEGHSFYIPDRFEINEFYSRKSYGYLVVEPINKILKKRQINVMNWTGSLGNVTNEVTGAAKRLTQKYLKPTYDKIPSWMKRSLYDTFHPSDSIDPVRDPGAVYQLSKRLPKAKTEDLDFVRKKQNPFDKYRLVKILKYNIAAYGRNEDYPDKCDDYHNIYELTSPDEPWLQKYIQFEEQMEQRGIGSALSDLQDLGGQGV